MSSLFGIGAGSASTGFYPETIDQSLRFDKGDGAELTRTPSSASNRKTWTLSTWVKISGATDAGGSILFCAFASSYADFISFDTSDRLTISFGNAHTIGTNALFRDPTNWFHVVVAVDVTQSTDTDRVKIYINGTQQTLQVIYSSYPSNTNYAWNNTVVHTVGGSTNFSGYQFDGYLAEFNFIDGSALTPSSFGETKNGVWIPKAISGLTYGTNGFRLTFADSSSLGDDTSGNGNDFTSSGLAFTDVVLDSPTNNFAVLNANEPSGATLSEGNLRFTGKSGVGAGYYATRATFGITSGKWYFEGLATDDDSILGIGTASASLDNYLGGDAHAYSYAGFNGQKYNNNSGSSYGATFGNGDIIGVAFDADNGTLTFYKNGATQGTAFTSLTATPYFPMVGETAQSSPITTHLNFGQDSSFAGNKTAQGNADENGMGDFYYSPPTGYLALCSANLPDTTISPNQDTQADDHFDTILRAGHGTSGGSTPANFKADWIWEKPRNGAYSHYLIDSSRGIVDGSTQALLSNTTNAELTANWYKPPTSSSLEFNTNDWSGSTNLVDWIWKAGGTTPTKTYKVVVVSDSGNKYRFRNSSDSATFPQSGVTLNLQELGTYVFDYSDSSAQGHPFRFSTTSDGTHGGGSEYTTGVVKDDSNYKITITVTSSAPQLYYYCSIHSGMGGSANTNSTFGSTNFDGDILSVVQTNETVGFSILTYTGTGSAGTIGHGLVGTAPDIVITKSRSATGKWFFFTTAEPTKYNYLNQTSAFTTSNLDDRFGNNTSVILPSSTVVTIGTNVDVNTSGTTYVSYVFAEVEGYSKFGSYIGNGSTDGTFIYTGFRPAWVMIKRTDSTALWLIFDNKRNGFNPDNRELIPDSSSTEQDYDRLDLISNGFKHRTSFSGNNGSGMSYIYMAFAEQPFKFSNAR